MFSSGSPYSPFFTSGLLPAAHHAIPGPRRGSLPTDSLSVAPSTSSAASLYFALQPTRDQKEYRSFLSLDLAESQSQRSASLKRKAQLSHMSSVPRLSPAVPPSPLRRRYSRDSFRSIPSPKPAPSITLPELPKAATAPAVSSSAAPRLPSIPNVASFDLMTISRTQTPKSLVTLPKRPLPTRTPTVSSVSTRVRKINRSNALDRLEGRVNSKISTPTTAPPSMSKFSMRRNFMSMSDDESDDDSDVDSLDAKSDYSDDFFSIEDNKLFYTGYLEPEDLVLPTLSAPSSPDRPKAIPSRRNSSSPIKSSFNLRKQAVRRSTKDWFPLKSFIDLHGNDDTSTLSRSVSVATSPSLSASSSSSWSWRSFIDVAHLR